MNSKPMFGNVSRDESEVIKHRPSQRPAATIQRPVKGTPEWDLWVAAVEVAASAPLKHGAHTHSASIPWSKVTALRDSLDAVGIDWRSAR